MKDVAETKGKEWVALLMESKKASFETLTPRQQQVAKMVAVGMQSRAIGHELGISSRTVEIHRMKCMEVMQAKGIGHLAAILTRLDLIPDKAIFSEEPVQ